MYSGWAFGQFVKGMANTKYPRNKKPKQKTKRNNNDYITNDK